MWKGSKIMNTIDCKIIKYLSEPIQNKKWHETKWFQKVETISYGNISETWTIADTKEQLPKIGDIIQQ